MDTIDSLLSRMRDMPLDQRLDEIDAAVLVGLARQARSPVSVSAMAMVTVLSLGIGLAGSLASTEPAHATTLYPLGTPVALAPSTLLGGR